MNPKGTRKNLKPFPPGVSGNPGARPRKRPVGERYAHFLEQPVDEEIRIKLKLAPGATQGDVGALMQARRFMADKTDAAKEIREAIEGRAPQRIELTGEEAPIDLTIGVDESLENVIRATELIRVSVAERARKAAADCEGKLGEVVLTSGREA
jgi:hypothetical protein